MIVFTFYRLDWLSPVTALAFGLAILKFGIVGLNQEWYRSVKMSLLSVGALTMVVFTVRAIIAVFRFPVPTTRPELTATVQASTTES